MAQASQAVAPYTVFVVDLAQNGGWPVAKSGVYDSSNATITITTNAIGDEFGISASNLPGGSDVGLGTQPPTGQNWVEGQTYPAARSADATHARLDMHSDGHGCNQSGGSITIREVVRDAVTQTLTAFGATYAFDCELSGTPIVGEIRWNSTVGFVAALANPISVDFGIDDVGGSGATRTVTVTSLGNLPTTFGAANLGGTTPSAYSIVGDTCSGATLNASATCTVTVEAHATKNILQTASLVIPENTTAGQRTIPLRVDGRTGARGTYYPLSPQRLMDTRTGNGAPKAPIGVGKVVNLQVTGRGGVPSSGAGSVVLNVTVVSPTAYGFVTVYPTGESRPTASSVNFAKGWTGSNSVTVKVGAGGKVAIYNAIGSTHVIVDVAGFYASNNDPLASLGAGGHYQWLKPFRLFDTRDGIGVVPAGYYLKTWLNFDSTINPHIRAMVVNITAVTPQRTGYLTSWDGSSLPPPSTSTVNYAAGKVVPNLAIVPTSMCWDCNASGTGVPSIAIYTSATTHLIVDVVGVIDDGTLPDGLRFKPLSPTRITDSRSGLGTPGALAPRSTAKITTPGSLITDTTEALALNVTGVTPTASTYLTVWPDGFANIPQPTVSNLNPAKGQTVANAAIAVIGPQDAFNVYNRDGTIHLLVDVVGTFYLYPGTASSASASAKGAQAGPGGGHLVVAGGGGGVPRIK